MAYTTPASCILQTPCEIEEIEMENQRSARATSNGASSSSTAADSNNSSSNIPLFDVFINHRGEVKKNFASHLYRALSVRGLKPFLDDQDLQEGQLFPSQLEAVISKASVHVAIFSPNYAESRWCLDELVSMLESGAPIIPVFYHVDPADLRWTAHNKTGVYAISVQKLELKKTFDAGTQQEKLRYDPATIQKWRDALSSVADINGFDLNGKFNGDEVHMIDKIVDRCLLAKATQSFPLAQTQIDSTELESRIMEMLQDMQNQLYHIKITQDQVADRMGRLDDRVGRMEKQLQQLQRVDMPGSNVKDPALVSSSDG